MLEGVDSRACYDEVEEGKRRLGFAWEMEAWRNQVEETSVVRQVKSSPSEAEAGEMELKQVELLKKVAQAQKGAPSRKEK